MRLLGMVMLAIAHSEDVCELGDCQNGVGTLHFGNLGTRYEGSSHDRVQDGCRSSVVWDAGQWVDANHHGLGVYTWADGTVYAGVSCLSPSTKQSNCLLSSARPLERIRSGGRTHRPHCMAPAGMEQKRHARFGGPALLVWLDFRG